MEWMQARMARWMKHAMEQNDWESWRRPDWWSPAWELLGEVRNENLQRLHPGSPLALKESITEDVLVMDEITLELKADSETGETQDWSSNPELINVASGVLWNSHGSTMLRRCDRGADPNELSLNLFQAIVKLVPDGCNVTYATCSDWLFDQWSDMMAWREIGYQGLDRDACPSQWKGIMEHVEQRIGVVTLVKFSDIIVDQKMHQAVSLHGEEGVQWYRELLATPLGNEYPPEAPEN
jgi:hypothetical protein